MQQLLRQCRICFRENLKRSKGTKAFISMLAGFYENCLVLFEDREEEMKVRDLPAVIDQYNVLFLP
ncbi:UNVERIFIED_ORG: hypothetical protein GGE13_005007 [Rhizobium etli]